MLRRGGINIAMESSLKKESVQIICDEAVCIDFLPKAITGSGR